MHREALHRRAETTEMRKHCLTDAAKPWFLVIIINAKQLKVVHLSSLPRKSIGPIRPSRVYVAAVAGSMKMGSDRQGTAIVNTVLPATAEGQGSQREEKMEQQEISFHLYLQFYRLWRVEKMLATLHVSLETTDAPCGVVEEPLHIVTLWTYQHATQQLDTSNINVLMTLRQASKNVTMSHQHAN
ncbi:hypothetical protein TESG_02490 [Trichophyton tonsurans CBS 112818]|uniref:Uncharacterized protein n=1 Tax=Trichophyton tonsurans (strain CBS 112818) TaxID=647933 RepID=F2RUJ6_TRIT1|nr:hypothetical protein TESG_02490 [Trichophyton tonsurans CBS 112818]